MIITIIIIMIMIITTAIPMQICCLSVQRGLETGVLGLLIWELLANSTHHTGRDDDSVAIA